MSRGRSSSWSHQGPAAGGERERRERRGVNSVTHHFSMRPRCRCSTTQAELRSNARPLRCPSLIRIDPRTRDLDQGRTSLPRVRPPRRTVISAWSRPCRRLLVLGEGRRRRDRDTIISAECSPFGDVAHSPSRTSSIPALGRIVQLSARVRRPCRDVPAGQPSVRLHAPRSPGRGRPGCRSRRRSPRSRARPPTPSRGLPPIPRDARAARSSSGCGNGARTVVVRAPRTLQPRVPRRPPLSPRARSPSAGRFADTGAAFIIPSG